MKPILFVALIGGLIFMVIRLLRRTQLPPVLRSVLAVIFGFFAMAITVTLCTFVTVLVLGLHTGAPTPLYLGLNVAYSLGAAVLGGWVTGDLAPARSDLHGGALGLLMVLLAIPGLLHPAPGQPAWYLWFLALIPPIAALAGAEMASRRMRI